MGKHRLCTALLLGAGGFAGVLGLGGEAAAVDYGSTTVTSVTLSGHEVFDDWRDYGRFPLRRTTAGMLGKHHTMDGTDDDANDLGLRDARIEIYESDKSYDASEPDCFGLQYVGSTT